jgi:hypothetical protein
MTDTGKPKTRATSRKSGAAAEPTTWFCKNCGAINAVELQECEHCGFSANFDPEAKPAVDFDVISATLEEQAETRRRQLRFYLELVKNALLLILVVVFLMVGFRLMDNWPFQGIYEQDASALLDEVLTVQSHLELGVTKGEYDKLLVPLMVQKTKFKLKYGDSTERQRETYQELDKAAEYYEFARVAWDNQLTGNDAQTSADLNARSEGASDEVKRRWDEAKRSAILVAKSLR